MAAKEAREFPLWESNGLEESDYQKLPRPHVSATKDPDLLIDYFHQNGTYNY